jgi:heterodisulfide reductase subunit A
MSDEEPQKSNDDEPRIGVYICHCGKNIAGTVDSESVAEYAEKLPNVVTAKDYLYTCSEPGQNMIRDDIKELGLNRVVVAACSPKMHENTFRKTITDSGLNPYVLEVANIREQCSWCHMNDKEKATEKAKDLVRMAVFRARDLEPLEMTTIPVDSHWWWNRRN